MTDITRTDTPSENTLVTYNTVLAMFTEFKDHVGEAGGIGSGNAMILNFTAPFAGSKFTLTNGTETKTGTVPASLTKTVYVMTCDTTFMLSATANDVTYTTTIEVGPYYGSYTVTLTTFDATLEVTTAAGVTVTATIDDLSYSGTADENGLATVMVRKAGTYAVNARLNEDESAETTVTATTDGETYELSLLFTIADLPTQDGTLDYNGSEQSPTWSGYDTERMTIDGDTSGTDAGTYTVTFTPKVGFMWVDTTTVGKTATWEILSAAIQNTPSQGGTLTYTGESQSPLWNDYNTNQLTIAGNTSGTNAGTYTVTFTPKDGYTWSDGTTDAREVTWSIAKADDVLTLSPSTLALTPEDATAEISVTHAGTGAVSSSSSDSGVATVAVDGITVTVTAVSAGSATITVSAEGDANYNAPVSVTCEVEATGTFATVYGVEWDGTSTTLWSRTDDAATFTDPVPYVANATEYGSPFDDIMPWAGMEKVSYTGAGTVVAIPKFYYKLEQVGAGMKIQISMTQLDGFVCSPTHMDRGDGAGERDVVYVGRYHCASSSYTSKRGVAPATNKTRSNARTTIHELGENIWMMDWATWFTLALLYLVEYANWDTQATIGAGCSAKTTSSSAVYSMGGTDSMPYHTGTVSANHSDYGNCQYRNIENLWGNCFDWLDGCYNDSTGTNLVLNPDIFSDTTGGVSLGGPTTAGYPSAFSVKNISGTFPCFVPSASSGSVTTYSCDGWSWGASGTCICFGGYYAPNKAYGFFYFATANTSNAEAFRGSRLMILPTTETTE